MGMNSAGETKPSSAWCPAQQGLEAADGAIAAEVDLRLVVQVELVAREGVAQGVFQLQVAAGIGIHGGGVEAEGVAPGALGFVHGDVGVLQQRLDAVAVAREERDAEAGRTVDAVALDLDRRRDGLDELACHHGDMVLVRDIGQEHDELVAAQARHGVLDAQRLAQPVGHFREDLIADLVAEAVVDGLEAVDVDDEDGQRFSDVSVLVQRLAQAILHQAAIGQAGEGVVVGHLVEQVLLLLVMRHVAGDAIDAQWLAVVAADDAGAVEQPAELAVGAHDAVFRAVRTLGHGLADVVAHALAVLCMHHFQPGLLVAEEFGHGAAADGLRGVVQIVHVHVRQADRPDDVAERAEQAAEPFLELTQGRFGFLVAAPGVGFFEFARNGGHQSRQVALDDIVLCAGTHGAHRHVLADVARDDDEGQVWVVLARDGQRLQAAELGHGVVGDDEVPAARVECRTQILGSLYAYRVGLEAPFFEGALEKQRVILGVLDQEQAQGAQDGFFRGVHGLPTSGRRTGRSVAQGDLWKGSIESIS